MFSYEYTALVTASHDDVVEGKFDHFLTRRKGLSSKLFGPAI
jgi:hypothetical protein